MSMPVEKPRPIATAETQPFWDGCARGELRVQKCGSCGRIQFPPRNFCVHCRASTLGWERCSGRGTVHSVTVVRRPALAAFKADAPYAIALVDLVEGVRMMMNIQGCAPEAVAIGELVEIVFEDRGEGVVVPQARVAG